MKFNALHLVCGLTVALGIGAARADVLWDQSTLDPDGPGIANSESPGFGGFVIHGVNDVTVGGDGWNLDSITTYYSAWNTDWASGAVTQAYLHVFPLSGALPIEDPTLSPLVPVTATFEFGDFEYIKITAAGLGLELAPGDYWISITPIGPAGPFGANLQWPTPAVGYDVALWEASLGWFAPYPGYDGAFLLEGTPIETTPVQVTSWGDIKSLYR